MSDPGAMIAVVLVEVADRVAVDHAEPARSAQRAEPAIRKRLPQVITDARSERRRRRDDPHRRRSRVLGRRRPEGVRCPAPASVGRRTGPTPTWAARRRRPAAVPRRAAAAHEAAHRRDQRRRGHRWVRGRAELRLPRRLGPRAVRRHARPRRRDAGLGTHGAAAAAHRRRPGEGDERHRQLRRRRDRARVGPREPRRAARGAAAVRRQLAADIVSNDQMGVRRMLRTYDEGRSAPPKRRGRSRTR